MRVQGKIKQHSAILLVDSGARDAKELENFLFDIEQYFRAMHTDLEKDKVAMYLARDAKL